MHSKRLSRLGAWALESLRPVPEFDQDADDLWRVVRRERLRSNLERVQRIVATDWSMSATRQLANRLAYAQLVRELADLRDIFQPNVDAGNSWTASALVAPPKSLLTRRDSQYNPKVEILEIGWRR